MYIKTPRRTGQSVLQDIRRKIMMQPLELLRRFNTIRVLGEREMFGLGMPELLVILVIILVIFGAGKLPQIGEGLGKGIRNFKKSVKEVEQNGEDSPEKDTKPSD